MVFRNYRAELLELLKKVVVGFLGTWLFLALVLLA
jgi:hypothetical protein